MTWLFSHPTLKWNLYAKVRIYWSLFWVVPEHLKGLLYCVCVQPYIAKFYKNLQLGNFSSINYTFTPFLVQTVAIIKILWKKIVLAKYAGLNTPEHSNSNLALMQRVLLLVLLVSTNKLTHHAFILWDRGSFDFWVLRHIKLHIASAKINWSSRW